MQVGRPLAARVELRELRCRMRQYHSCRQGLRRAFKDLAMASKQVSANLSSGS